MHHNGLFLSAVLPLTFVALIALSGEGAHSFKITEHRVIEKGRPHDASMDCNTGSREKCTWHLGPLSLNLTNEDPPDLVQRHTVTVNQRSKTCELKISDLKFEDQGVYECYGDGSVLVEWIIELQVNPGKPTITYENRTQIDELVVIDETPVTLPLRCVSSDAKPKQKNLRWEINGEAPANVPGFSMMGPVSGNGPWTADSNLWLTFSEEDGVQRAVKRVTCIMDHVSGQQKTMKVFGVRNDDRTVNLVHVETANSERGKLECSANLFPWPTEFKIMKMGEKSYTHFGQEVDVKEDGRYVCSAGEEVKTADGRTKYNWFGESNIIVIGDDPSGSMATSAAALCLVVMAAMSALFLAL